MSDGVDFTVEDHVARVTIDRPEVLNALDLATERQLEKIWAEIGSNADIYVAVLTGAGDRAFCAGADLREETTGLEYWARMSRWGFGAIWRMSTEVDVPIIARVNGYALGGGFELVLGCDLAIASDDSQFGFTEPRVGLVPLGGGSIELARRIPSKSAMGLLLTGRRIDAEEALALSLVNEVVSRDELDVATDRWLEGLLSCAPLALRAMKQLVNNTRHLSIEDAIALKLPSVFALFGSHDSQEGVAAFTEKRKPNWQGR